MPKSYPGPAVFVDLLLEVPFRAKVQRSSAVGGLRWEFHVFKSIRVDVVPLLAPLLERLAAGFSYPAGEDREARLVATVRTLFEEPPEFRARCSWVDKKDRAKLCPFLPVGEIKKGGKVVGFLCVEHDALFRDLPADEGSSTVPVPAPSFAPASIAGIRPAPVDEGPGYRGVDG